MAVYAQEGAVAQSARALHTVTVQTGLPWANEVPELIDELAAEKLPAALMDPILTERRARHEQRRAAAAAKAEAKARIDELEPREHLAAGELDELERLAAVAYGEYTMAAWQLREKVRARRASLPAGEADDGSATTGDEPDRATHGADEDQRPESAQSCEAHGNAGEGAIS